MEYGISYDTQNACLIGFIKGKLDLSGVNQFIRVIKDAMIEHDCKLIVNDLREVELEVSAFEIFVVPKFIEEIDLPEGFKRALVASNDFKKYDFFQNISSKRGQCMGIFRDIDEAITWLKEE